jgi:hypothetical protein
MADENETIDLVPLLKRTFAWDVLPCGQAASFFPCLGLLPGSDEGTEAEHAAKHDRFDRLQPVRGVVEVYTSIVSDVITKVMLRYDLEENRVKLDESGALQAMTEQNQEIIRIALYASLSQMLDNGVLEYGKALK